MTNLEIKIRLEQILAKIQDNVTSGWNDDLESTFECVVLEDGRDVEYNGWISELEALHDDIIA
jgi:hypothetical protein